MRGCCGSRVALGKGLLVYVVNGGTTQLWRAPGWLDKLEPVAEVWGSVVEICRGVRPLTRALRPVKSRRWISIRGANYRSACSRQPPAFRCWRSLTRGARWWSPICVARWPPSMPATAGPDRGRGGIVVRLAVRGTDFSLETASEPFWLGPGGDFSTIPRGASRSPLFTPLTPLTPSVARTERPPPARVHRALSRAALFGLPSKTGGR